MICGCSCLKWLLGSSLEDQPMAKLCVVGFRSNGNQWGMETPSLGLTCSVLSQPFGHQWGSEGGFLQGLTQESIARPLRPGSNKGSLVNSLLYWVGAVEFAEWKGPLELQVAGAGDLALCWSGHSGASTLSLFWMGHFYGPADGAVKKG